MAVSQVPATWASDSAAHTLTLEQVTVTARKRAEDASDVPVSISAFSAADLSERGLSNLQELSSYVPGLDLGRTNTGNAARVYIRGVGQRDPRNFVDPAVGLYVDGVYLARADGALLDLVDVESVEVLRGPQGVLFGKNTVGGAIRINSRAPGKDAEKKLSFRFGSLERADATLRLSGQLSESLNASLALNSVNRAGYLHNATTSVRFNNERRQAMRAQLLWQPESDFTLRTIIDAGRQRERGAGAHCVTAVEMSGTLGASPVGSALDIDGSCAAASSSALGVGNTLVNRGRYDLDTRAISMVAQWSINNFDVSSISSIRHQRLAIASDQDGSAADAITLAHHRPDRRTQWSQEFTMASSALNDTLFWTAGVYLFDEENSGEQLDAIIGPDGVVPLPAAGGSQLYVLGTSRDSTETAVRSYATYAHVDWEFWENWRLSTGLRYTWEKRKLSAVKATLNPDLATANNGAIDTMPGRPLTPNGGLVILPENANLDPESVAFGVQRSACGLTSETCSGTEIWRRLTPSLTLSTTQLTENSWLRSSLSQALVYLTASQGFKSGAINLLSNRLSIADPEKLNNIELGVKLASTSGRFGANASVFIAKYTSIQVPIAVPPAAGDGLPAGIADTGLVNAAKAAIKGGELELRFLSNWGASGNLSLSYLDANYQQFDDQFGAGDRSAESFSGIPQWTVQLGVQWLMGSENWGAVIPRLDYSWQSKTEHHFGYSSFLCECFVQSAYSKLNARVHWKLPRSGVELTAFANNMLDEHTIYGASPLVDVIGGGPVFPDAPRTYGIELRFDW